MFTTETQRHREKALDIKKSRQFISQQSFEIHMTLTLRRKSSLTLVPSPGGRGRKSPSPFGRGVGVRENIRRCRLIVIVLLK
jgi:hypothetical protein